MKSFKSLSLIVVGFLLILSPLARADNPPAAGAAVPVTQPNDHPDTTLLNKAKSDSTTQDDHMACEKDGKCDHCSKNGKGHCKDKKCKECKKSKGKKHCKMCDMKNKGHQKQDEEKDMETTHDESDKDVKDDKK